MPSTQKRIVCAAVVGALSAVCYALLSEYMIVKAIVASLGALLIGIIAPKKVTIRRRMKFFFSFLIFGALVGGAVNFTYGLLDRFVYCADGELGGVENRRLLIFSLIVLLSIGVFKMIVSFFSNIESEGSVKLIIDFCGRTLTVEAFIDSGNLATDPMDMRPVLFLKEAIAAELFPDELIEMKNPDLLERDVRKRIRLIPVSFGGVTKVLTGVRPDSVRTVGEGRQDEISVTVAIDREGGNYGGFNALVPSAALNDAWS